VVQSSTVLPVQLPVPAIAVHPGHCVALQLLNCPQLRQSSVGVPWHVGPTENTTGGSGACRLTVVQQIMPEQSLSVWHDWGHVAAQIPSQQRASVPLQSFDVVQGFGQDVVLWGFRHRPGTLRLGSILLSVVQHTWPLVVSQSLLVVHDLGQSFAARQMLVL
jgi:hypothetical protein